MRKSRERPGPIAVDAEAARFRAPWPSWNYVFESGCDWKLHFDWRISPDLFALAREFSETLYLLRLELKPLTVKSGYDDAMLYLRTLSHHPEMQRPVSIADLSSTHIAEYESVLKRPSATRVVLKRANPETYSRYSQGLRRIVKDAWRLGVACATTRPDLGQAAVRSTSKGKQPRKIIYSRREYKAILQFLMKRRSVPRGNTLLSERVYLATCICVFGIFCH